MYYFKKRFCFLPHFYVEKQGKKTPQGTCPTPIPWILGFVSEDCWGMALSGRGAQLVWVGELGGWLLTPQLPEGWEFKPEIQILSISLESAKGGSTDTVYPEWFLHVKLITFLFLKPVFDYYVRLQKTRKGKRKKAHNSTIHWQLLFMMVNIIIIDYI